MKIQIRTFFCTLSTENYGPISLKAVLKDFIKFSRKYLCRTLSYGELYKSLQNIFYITPLLLRAGKTTRYR